MINQFEIIDTFPSFLKFWEKAQAQPLDKQLDLWVSDYMSQWPELLTKQQTDYASQDINWRTIGKERIFPFLAERLPLMTTARECLLACIETVYQSARQSLGLDFNVLFFIHVGIGCGAGWATTLAGRPACLFGLENIAECGFTDHESLSNLTAHELGHLIHDQWRQLGEAEAGTGPFWTLCQEGFAKRCEQLILKDTCHGHNEQSLWDDESWYEENKRWLAAEFLRTVDQHKPINVFFGSWYDIEGHNGCGHYLGYQIIRMWEEELDFKAIAVLPWDEIQHRARKALEFIAD